MDVQGVSVVVLHPHPEMGGDSSHPFVTAVAARLISLGAAVATPDIRDPDVTNAAQHIDGQIVVGYSWGSVVVSHASPEGLAARVLVAPPAAMTLGAHDPSIPTLVLIPEHDQYGDLAATRAAFGDHPNATVDVIAGVDHFLWGSIDAIADRVVDWLAAQ